MRKILLSALLAVLLCIPWTQMSAQRITSTATAADGTATENHVPVYGYFCDQSQVAQMIYPASELLDLSTGDTITKLHFFVYSGSSSSWSTASFEVRLANTTQADLSSSYDQTAGTLVYTGTLSADVTNGMEVTLTTPFEYTGGNLLVDFRLPTSSGYSQCYFYGITSTGGGRYHYGNSSITSGGTVVNFLAKCEFTVRTIAPTCYPVTDLVASNVTATSADFYWTASGQGETQYQYLCIPATDTINWANAQTATTTSATVTGLNPNTNYRCYVRSYCSATDQSKSVYTAFRTPCAAVDPVSLGTIGFETSEGFTTGSGNFANCWEGGNMQSTSTSYMPYVQANSSWSTYSRTGDNCLKMQALSSSYTTADSCYAVLPEFTYTGGIASYEAHFYMCKTSASYSYANYNDTLYVGIVSDPADLSDLEIVGYAVNSTTSYAQQIVSFSGYTGGTTGYIVFLAKVDQNASISSKYASFYIDDLEIIKGRSTRTPVVDSIFNITTTTVDVAFSGSNATSYRIVAATEPVSDPETYTNWAIDTVVTASPATINVQSATKYYLYVQGFGQDTSFFSNPATQFQSGCDVVAAFPWTENFDEFTTSGEFGKPCWFNELVSGPGIYPAQIAISGQGDNTTPQLYFKDQTQTTYTRVSTPEFNIPTAGAYEFNIDVYRSSSQAAKTLEGVQVIVENTNAGYDTTFIPRLYSNTAGVGAEDEANVWYTYTISLPKAGVQRVILLGCNQYGSSTYVDNLRVRKSPTCFKVDSVAVRDNQPTQATIEWRNGTSAKYQVLFTSENINPDTLSTVPASVIAFNDSTASNVDSIVATGLTPATQYYVYVRGLCAGEQSDWSTALVFRTACQVLTISRTNIYTEGFENIDDNSKVVPCWDINTTSANYPKVYNYEYYAHTGDKCLYFGSYNGGNDTTYMTLPEVTNPVNTLRLKFWLQGYSTQSQYNDSILVGVMTTDSMGNDVFNRVAGFQAQTDDYELYEVNFDEYTGANGRIAMVRVPVEYVSYWYSQYWGSNIDDVTIDLVPTCKKPNDFVASNLTKRSADLSWTASTASAYEVIVADQSIDPANLDSAALTHIIYNDTTITADSVTVYGLASLTTYYAYLRGNCGAGDISDWTNGISFQTAMAMNYVDDFSVSMLGSTYTSDHGVDSLLAGSDHLIATTYNSWETNTNIASDSASIKWNVYGTDASAYYVTPLIDLNDAQTASVSFDVCRRAYNSANEATNVHESDNTVFHVMISTDGLQTFQNLFTFRNDSVEGDPVGDTSMYYGISTYYRNFSIDLSPYLDQAVQVVFGATSITSNQDYDLHLDDITIAGAYDSVAVVANVNDTTMGYVEGAGNVVKNDNVTLTAVANTGYHFVSWSNGATTEAMTFFATQDTAFTATFAPDSFNITALTADSVMGNVTGSGRFPYGYTAQLTATANTGYHFVNWSNGDVTASIFVTVTNDSTITATFAPDTFTVTLNVNDTAMGTVEGAGSYTYNTVATLTATPNYGYHFVNWSNGDTTETITYTVTADTTLTANFAKNQYTVTLNSNPAGASLLFGDGTYNYLDTAKIYHRTSSGYDFNGWSTGATTDTIYVVVTGDTTITANCSKKSFTVSANINDTTMGYVIGTGIYEYGDTATLVAVPYDGYHFTCWDNGIYRDSVFSSIHIVVSSDTAVTAIFGVGSSFNVTVNTVGEGTVTGAGEYNYGDNVTLTATPADGYEFTGWSNGETDTTITFVIRCDTTFTATFTKISTSVDNVEAAQYVAYTEGQRIVVTGVEGHTVSLFDATGRLIATRTDANETETFDAPLAGVYMIKVNGMNTTAIVVK